MCVSEKEIGYLAYINLVLLDFFARTFFWEKGGGGGFECDSRFSILGF